ncbi:MAG: bifunctional folylpolyglutamate synthase/dihydrofolate synthase [Lachnospiraceae bacterium]|nr:bifunctional folylpolyglutamate synthase/dihydrofolate synthase [Lachnospiraceae bacterium]
MTYNEAMEYINNVGKKGSILGLEPITQLLLRLGNPQDRLSIIHVAGTNGKGSICTFLEMLYRSEGKKVGRYISPTIHEYLERFQINGAFMEKDMFAKFITEVDNAVSAMESEGLPLPTAFEIETAVAFLYFVNEAVDIVILEVGMGGREDATNVIKKPLCTVFANIGMDHMQFLGDTIEKIAYEKAGIIKRGCPAVAYPMDERSLGVIREEYNKVNVVNIIHGNSDQQDTTNLDMSRIGVGKIVVADTSEVDIISENLDGSTFIYKGEEYSISLAGTYQIYNAITAIETKLLLDGHMNKDALSKASWEGRFEKISDYPTFIKDGAHNIQGVTALKESLEKHFTNRKFIFIIGVLQDKEYEKMMERLCPMASACYLIKPDNPRGLDTLRLSEVVRLYCSDVTSCESVKEAKDMALERWHAMRGKDLEEDAPVIVAWGSLSYIGNVVM